MTDCLTGMKEKSVLRTLYIFRDLEYVPNLQGMKEMKMLTTDVHLHLNSSETFPCFLLTEQSGQYFPKKYG